MDGSIVGHEGLFSFATQGRQCDAPDIVCRNSSATVKRAMNLRSANEGLHPARARSITHVARNVIRLAFITGMGCEDDARIVFVDVIGHRDLSEKLLKLDEFVRTEDL